MFACANECQIYFNFRTLNILEIILVQFKLFIQDNLTSQSNAYKKQNQKNQP